MGLVYVFVAICRRLGITASANELPISGPHSRRTWRGSSRLSGGRVQLRDTFHTSTRRRSSDLEHLGLSQFVRQVHRTLRPGNFAHSTGEQRHEVDSTRSVGVLQATIGYDITLCAFWTQCSSRLGFGIVLEVDSRSGFGRSGSSPAYLPDSRFPYDLEDLDEVGGGYLISCVRGRRRVWLPCQSILRGMVVRSDDFTAACVIDWIVSSLASVVICFLVISPAQ